MKVKRVVVLGGVLGGLAALMAGAATSVNRRIDIPAPAVSPAVQASGAELAAEITRLHERLRPTAAPQRPVRNLFQFAATHAVRAQAVPTPAVASVAPVIAAPPPAFKLIGIAEDAAADGTTVRTAIISTSRDVLLVKEGEAVGAAYHVEKISMDAVELASDAGTPLRLALK